jgi:aromatic ring-opening dioxygenase catalytic subunit (LigB family)
VKRGVDSGITVPLHFLLPSSRLPVVPLSLAERSAAECRAWGATLRSVLVARPERIAFVVGGMLAYNQHAWSLGRDLPEARVFDERLLEALRTGAWDAVRSLNPAEAERIQPQAGLRHLELLRGFLGSDPPGVVLCYETGPGVGSALMEFELVAEAPAGAPGPAG